jgi:putative tricarboxylic transport membrane protein
MKRDVILGAIALAFGAFYMREAARIPRSALGDAVGAGGVPLVLGFVMCLCGLLLIVRTLWLWRAGTFVPEPVSEVFADPRRLFVMAGGLVAMTAAYFTLLNPLGYIPAMALYLTGVIHFQRVPLSARSVLVAAAGAVGLWLLFDAFLGIDLPDGLLAGVL